MIIRNSVLYVVFVLGIASCLTACREHSVTNLPLGPSTEVVSPDAEQAESVLATDMANQATDTDVDAAPTETIDTAYFKKEYAEDKANQEFQTEQEYVRWVREFYEAQATILTPAGWSEQSKNLLARLETSDARANVRELMDSLGKRIAAEWAKDKRASKLDVINGRLKWSAELKAAEMEDDGTGLQIIEALARIDQEVAAMLGN